MCLVCVCVFVPGERARLTIPSAHSKSRDRELGALRNIRMLRGRIRRLHMSSLSAVISRWARLVALVHIWCCRIKTEVSGSPHAPPGRSTTVSTGLTHPYTQNSIRGKAEYPHRSRCSDPPYSSPVPANKRGKARRAYDLLVPFLLCFGRGRAGVNCRVGRDLDGRGRRMLRAPA